MIDIILNISLCGPAEGMNVIANIRATVAESCFKAFARRALMLASATTLATTFTSVPAQAADQLTVVLQAPMWGCPTIYQAASWATRERCVMVKPPAVGRRLDGLSVQGNDYLKVAVDGGKSLWFSAAPQSGPWQTWLSVDKGEDPIRAAAEAANHSPPVSVFPEPARVQFDKQEVEHWKNEGISVRTTPASFKANASAWVCYKVESAIEVQDAAERVSRTKGADAEAATHMLHDSVARCDCWLMDKGTEGLDLGNTADGEFRNVVLYRFPYGAPVIMVPRATSISGWTATENRHKD